MTSGQACPYTIRGRCRSLDEVSAWIAASVFPVTAETLQRAELCGRILAAEVVAPGDEPPHARASQGGLAIRAADLVGATAYNPMILRLSTKPQSLAAGEATPVKADEPVPRGSDAVIPLDYVHRTSGDQFEVIDAVPSGYAIEIAGSHVRRGATIFSAGRRLDAADIGVFAQLGIGNVSVIRRPRIGLVLVGPHNRDTEDQSSTAALQNNNGPMLQRLIERDGGIVAFERRIDRNADMLRAAISDIGVDAIFVVGSTGGGSDDQSSAVLADAGTMAIGGIALDPGGATALGHSAQGIFVCLLPGRASAYFWAYEIVVGGAVRRLGGRDQALPFETESLALARKIVSTIGMAEIWPVRINNRNRAEPVTSSPRDSLLAFANADGFVIVPEASEGVPAGATTRVYLRGSRR